MVSRAALDELQRFAEQGRIGGAVLLSADPPRLQAGESVVAPGASVGCAWAESRCASGWRPRRGTRIWRSSRSCWRSASSRSVRAVRRAAASR
jgi:hypothetical protein